MKNLTFIIRLLLTLSISFSLIVVAQSGFAARPFFDLGIDVAHDDNIGRAELDSDRLSDKFITASASANYLHQINYNSGVVFKALGEWIDYQHYYGLDHYVLGISATYRYKPELTYSSPWFSFGLKAKRLEYSDSKLRNGYTYEAEAMAGKRFTDRIMGKVGLAHHERIARTDEKGLLGEKLFETQTTKAFIGMDYFLDKFIFYGQYTFQNGDVISTGRATRKIVLAADEIQQDDAIGRDPNNNIRWAYRLTGDTHIADLGVNYSLSRAAALDFTVRAVEVKAAGGNTYDNYSAHLGLLYRFK